MHQDLYGALSFPLQVVVMLSDADEYDGGHFLVTEHAPRMQARAEVMTLGKGDGVVFAVNARPVPGVRGDKKVVMRHGVSRVTRGERMTLGIIFHDAAS